MMTWFAAWLTWSKKPAGERGPAPTPPPGKDVTGIPGYEDHPVDLKQRVLAAGLYWLFDTVQPDGALDSHHGTGPRSAEDRTYSFIPSGHAGMPVVVMEIHESAKRWAPRRGLMELANPLTDADVTEFEDRLTKLGHTPARSWNGAGCDTVSMQLAERAHPTLLAAVAKYRRGCPEHAGPLCSWDGCKWYPDARAKLVHPSWPVVDRCICRRGWGGGQDPQCWYHVAMAKAGSDA
jgi:hypothetical protein